MKLLTHVKFGGLYDFNEKSKKLSKVFKTMYSQDDSIEYIRHYYDYVPENYVDATLEDIKKHEKHYYGKMELNKRKKKNKDSEEYEEVDLNKETKKKEINKTVKRKR